MKNLQRIPLRRNLVFLVLFSMGAVTAQAQSDSKIGYADVDYIFGQLPDAKRIESEMKAMETQLTALINGKTQELQKKYTDYMANAKTMLDAVRTNTERELQGLQENLEKLKQDAQTSFEKKQEQLVTPVQNKIGTAIEAVAKENGFTFVLTTRVGAQEVLLYKDEKVDISNLVLKKLGVTPTALTAPKDPQVKQ